MKLSLALSACCALVMAAASPAVADTAKSQYTKVDLKKCTQMKGPDEHVVEGSWRCPGVGGYDIYLQAADSREVTDFRQAGVKACEPKQLFTPFNRAGDVVEWRLRGTAPYATIQRWTLSDDATAATKTRTWLVISKLANGISCPVHYVAGSFPKANEAARAFADTKADGFDCTKDKATFDSKVGVPEISLEPCAPSLTKP